MTKHSGSILTEVLISILLFTIGLLALMGAISFSVGSIMKSSCLLYTSPSPRD